MEYQKRPGTSGIEGQFYETKYLALLDLRLRKDKRVTDFRLATNMDEMGAYDDICVKINIVGHERPVALFIQQKHREQDVAFLTINKSKPDLIKYINGFIEIKTKMSSLKDDFCKDLRIEDSIFILYTNAEFKVTNTVLKSDDLYTTFNHSQNVLINDLLVTSGTVGRQLRCSDELVENFAITKLEGDLMLLAEHFTTYLCDETKQANIMNDEYIKQYHVILTTHVVDVSDIRADKTNNKFRTLTFRHKFFGSQNKYIESFRQILFQEILKKHPKMKSRRPARPAHDSLATEAPVDDLIASFLFHKSAVTLSPLFATHIASKEDGTLEFLIDRPLTDVERLQKIKMSPETIAEAYLRSLKLNVSVGFGNIDMVMSGSPEKIEKRLNHLVTRILDLCKRYKQLDSLKVVTIDDTVDGGLLNHSGGLASGVGNILICDENTTMLRFANNFTPLQSNAKALYDKLIEKTKQIHEYRFDVKTTKFPKLHFDCINVVKEFISKLVIYEKQSNQSKLEEYLKDEIQNLLYKKPHHCTLPWYSVFLHYHDEILHWWMRKTGTYLNKTNNLYELAINNIMVEPQISDLCTTFYKNNSRCYWYSFKQNTPKWLELAELPSEMLIVTDTVTLTSMKVIQCLRNLYAINKYAVFDLECVANLLSTDFCSLEAELRKTEKVLIIVWHSTDNSKVSHKTLYELAQATKDKQIVIITNDALMEKIILYFSCIKVFRDETQDLTSMTPESQKDVTENCKVVFQGQAVSLDLVVDDVSLSFIKGVVLDKITRNQTIYIGAPLGNPQYEEMKHWYIDRTVRDMDEEYKMTIKDLIHNNYVRYPVSKFDDIANDVVLLTAPSGMGKSTLLTHLSLNTKECDTNLWIVRVSFINHSDQFEKWENDDTHVDALEALKFLCQVVFSDKNVSFSVALTNDEASLVNCAGDALITFDLNMFLHHYNRRKLIFVFDGFDEICPDYKQKVIEFLIVVKTHLKKNKMWVTSRPYSDILPDLQRVLGRGFRIELLSYQEQESYLQRFWQEKSLNEKLSKQLKQLDEFIEDAEQSISEAYVCIQFIYYNFVVAVRPIWCRSQTFNKDIDERLERFRRRPVDDAMSGTPLILYFIADYFVNVVDNKRLKLIINLHDIYKKFIENKIIKMIPNGNKNWNKSTTAVKSLCKKERVSLLNVYKKLAANDLFRNSMFKLEEFKDMKPLNNEELIFKLSEIKTGADNTGLISHVTADNVPVFIHRSFTEYFAAEYVCDLLKSREFNKSKKILWNCYLIFYQHKGVRDWIKTKKKVDQTLQDVFKEIEEPLPIYATEYGNYLTRCNLSDIQYIRMLASSVDDYENGCFSLFSDGFTLNDRSAIDKGPQQYVIEILKNYNISKMKAHLKKHFVDFLAIYRLINETLHRDFSLADVTISYEYTYNYHIAIEMVGQKRSVPLLMRLEHKDNDDASTTLYIKINLKCDNTCFESNNKIISQKDCDKFGGVDIDETKFLYILHDYGKIQEVLYTKHYPSYGAFKKFLATTNIVRCRLRHSEQNIEELANILFKNELSLLAYQLLSILNRDIDKTFLLRDFDEIKQYRYRAIFKEKVVGIEEDNLKYTDWRIWMFRDDFLDTDDQHVFRNCLLEGILYEPSIRFLEELKPDDLISSFLSEPSAATLTPLIGAYIVCCEEGELQFVIERPQDDIERLKQINIQQSVIDKALIGVRTAAIEYLRSLQLKVPVDFVDGYVDVGGSTRFMSNIDYAVESIVKLCKEYNQTNLYKVVTIEDIEFFDTFAHGILTAGVASILTYDEQSGLLKFSKEFTATQKNAKFLFLKLSKKIENLHEYRFNVKYKTFSEVHVDCTNTARKFLNNLVIYTEQGSHYEEKKFVNLKSVRRDAVEYSKIKFQLSLLHYHSETIKWWTTPNTGASLTKSFLQYAQSRGTDTCPIKTRDLYRQASHNITVEPLISELHTKFHMNSLRYLGYRFSKRNSKWKETLEIPCRTIIVTDTVTLTTVEVMQFLRNNDSSNNYRVLDLDVFNIRRDLRSLWVELRQTDKFLIIVWHAPQPRDSETLHELAEAIKDKQLVVVTNNESRVNTQEYFKSTNLLSIEKKSYVNQLVIVLIFAFFMYFYFYYI